MESLNQPVAILRWEENQISLYPGQQVRVGRAAENEIVLQDPKISRSHAVLGWNGSGFTIKDMGSINGTYVNGERLARAPRLLRDGDQVTLSRLEMVYEIVRAEKNDPLQKPLEVSETEPLLSRGAYMIVTLGPDMGQVFPLWGECITIGRASRDATWEIRLTDHSVSRPHARVDHTGQAYTIVDLNSANGILVNGAVIHEPVSLNDGDTLTLGETSLLFHL